MVYSTCLFEKEKVRERDKESRCNTFCLLLSTIDLQKAFLWQPVKLKSGVVTFIMIFGTTFFLDASVSGALVNYGSF